MKSALTYEMHNYAAVASPPNISDTKNEKGSSRKEKYSLRQRQKRKHALANEDDSPMGYNSDNNNNKIERADYHPHSTPISATKSKNSKSVHRHEGTSGSTTTTAKTTIGTSLTNSSKAKTKAAPLSKYRRKTANARERTRMREINSAFENLRNCVPQTITGEDAATTNEKLTKITTLRMAMKYIRILTEALADPGFEADFLLECQRDGDHRFTTNPSPNSEALMYTSTQYDEDDLDELLDEPQLPVKVKKSKSMQKNTVTNATTHSRKTPSKRQSKATTKKKLLHQMNFPCDLLSSTASISSSESVSSASSASSTSAYASLSSATSSFIVASSPPSSTVSNSSYILDSSVNSAYISNVSQSMSDLSTMLLESDGESLHLSEHCLSPLQGGNSNNSHYATKLLGASANVTASAISLLSRYETHSSDSITMSTLENPLELSLRLLESSADPMDFSVDQQPPSCISPLATLDSFNPFGDLLHSDFPEHNSLDLFLT